VSGEYHYVNNHQSFSFTATYASKTPLEVWATGFYSNNKVKLPAKQVGDGIFEYTISMVMEPWDITFGDIDPYIGNAVIRDDRVWSYKNILYVNVSSEDIVSIYNMTGVLYQKIEIPAGLKKLILDRGVYVVTLKDGSVHRIIIN